MIAMFGNWRFLVLILMVISALCIGQTKAGWKTRSHLPRKTAHFYNSNFHKHVRRRTLVPKYNDTQLVSQYQSNQTVDLNNGTLNENTHSYPEENPATIATQRNLTENSLDFVRESVSSSAVASQHNLTEALKAFVETPIQLSDTQQNVTGISQEYSEPPVQSSVDSQQQPTTEQSSNENAPQQPLTEQSSNENAPQQPLTEQSSNENASQQPATEQSSNENASQQPVTEQLSNENAPQQPATEQSSDENTPQQLATEQSSNENASQQPVTAQSSNENASKRGTYAHRKETFVLSNPKPKITENNNVNHFLERAHEQFLPFRLTSHDEQQPTYKNIDDNPESSLLYSPSTSSTKFTKSNATAEESATRELQLKEIGASENLHSTPVTRDSSESNVIEETKLNQPTGYTASYTQLPQPFGNLAKKVSSLKNRLDSTESNFNDLDKSSATEMITAKPKYKLQRLDELPNDESLKEGDKTNEKDSGKITNVIQNLFGDDKDGNREKLIENDKLKNKDSGLLIDKNSQFFVENELQRHFDNSSAVPNDENEQKQESTQHQDGGSSAVKNHSKGSSEKINQESVDGNNEKNPVEKNLPQKEIHSNLVKGKKHSSKEEGVPEVEASQEERIPNGKPPKPEPLDNKQPPQSSPNKRPTTMVEVNEHQQMTSSSYFEDKPVAAFSYDEKSPYGPLSWHLLNPTWTCRSRKQSPINIDTNSLMQNHLAKNIMMKVVPEGKPLSGTLKNNGHSPTFTLSPDSVSVRLFGATLNNDYFLKQFHFHFGCDSLLGSEHHIDGVPFPLEMHLVFWDSSTYDSFPEAAKGDRGLAVVAVLFQVSVSKIAAEPTDALPLTKLVTILRRIEDEGDGIIIPEEFDLRFESILPNIQLKDKADRFYVYDGSLSTPGCYESVVWIVMATHPVVTEDQLKVFRKLKSSKVSSSTGMMCNNFRSIQKKYGRKVYSNII